jgi:hypothetical protein
MKTTESTFTFFEYVCFTKISEQEVMTMKVSDCTRVMNHICAEYGLNNKSIKDLKTALKIVKNSVKNN